MSELCIGGYHGTSISNAKRIAESGFSSLSGDVYFAPLDNLSFALSHGRRRAEEYDEDQFGVIQGLFPGHELEIGLRGDQIRIPRSQVDQIQIVRFMA